MACECGAYRSFEFRNGQDVCRGCGHVRQVARQPLLVVTGGAASGKSSICRAWERDSRVFALDLDVIGRDPVVRRPGDTDYVGFWGFLLRLGLEVQLNGLAPLFCGLCLPEQITANAEAEQFHGVHVLALVCEETELTARIQARFGGTEAAARPDVHFDVNRRLRAVTLPEPHTYTILDTSGWRVADTLRAAEEWVQTTLHIAEPGVLQQPYDRR